MKTISEIFKTKPELLEEKEVKELIEQFRVQFMSLKMKHHNYWDKVTSLTMNSEFFVKEGLSSEKVVEQIHNISFETDYISA
jgi:DNA polymerase III delta prime subunit